MIIDGKAIADKIRLQIAAEVATLKEQYGIQPGLATVIVGENAASQTYVRMKRKACADLGMTSFGHELPADISQADLER